MQHLDVSYGTPMEYMMIHKSHEAIYESEKEKHHAGFH